MLAIQLSLNILWYFLVAVFSFLLGMALRSAQVAAARRRTEDINRDLLNAHAEILELHSEKSDLEQKLKDSPSIPVIPIKSNKDESNSDKMPDVGMRKKLLGGNQPSSAQSQP